MADHTVTVACPPQNSKPCTNSVNNFANLPHGDMTVKDEGLLSKPHKDADRNINHCNGSLQTESDFALCKGIKENEAMKKCFNDHSMISDITVSQLKSTYLEEVNGLSHRVIRHSSGDDLRVVHVLNTCKREAAENEIDDCSGDSNRLSENTCLCKAIEYDVFCDDMESEKRFMPEAHYNTGYNDVNALLSDLENTSLHELSDSSEICISSNDIIDGVSYVVYESEKQMPDIMRLITKDLSEPYSIYTYRYFIHNWPKLCFLAISDKKCVGAIVCKLDLHKKMVRRGYIAMLAVDSEYRRRQIGSTLVTKAIEAMIRDDCDEVVLETEITNQGALRLYENLGFVRDKRLFRYYLNGVDALRLKLWLR